MKPTQEQVIAWAREAGFSHYKTKDFAFDRWLGRSEALEIAYFLAYEAGRKDENEACAKLLDVTVINDEYATALINNYADAIRARGEQ